jgi:hypothetical protein
MSDVLQIAANESMFILDGGPNAGLPSGSGGPVLAGPEAIFVAGRVAVDAPTVLRVGGPGGQGSLVPAYSGVLSTPDQVLRVLNIDQVVLGEVRVPDSLTPISIFLTDLEEPDEIYVAISSVSETVAGM